MYRNGFLQAPMYVVKQAMQCTCRCIVCGKLEVGRAPKGFAGILGTRAAASAPSNCPLTSPLATPSLTCDKRIQPREQACSRGTNCSI